MASKAQTYSNTLKSVEEANERIIARVIEYLKGKNKFATGSLIRSFKYRTKFLRAQGVVISNIDFNYYGVYVNFGRPPGVGKQPPIKAIKKWCKIKGINENLAYPIAKNIKIRGIKPTNFYQFIENMYVKVGDIVAKGFEKDVQEIINEEIIQLQKNLK